MMKKTLVFLLSWMFLLPVFSQSAFPNDELVVFMTPESTPEELQILLTELDMSVVAGPTTNLGALLIKFNSPPIIPSGGNPNGPINGGKQKANSKGNVGGVGFNFALSTGTSSTDKMNILTAENCYDILDPTTQTNGGNSVLTAIFDSGISPALTANNGYFDLNDPGMNMLNPGLFPKDDNGHGSHISSIVMNNLENTNGAVQLKSYKTHDNNGEGSVFDVIRALDQAISDGVQIINMSFSFITESEHTNDYKAPLKYALEKALNMSGILCIASAGNNDSDNDFNQQLVGVSEYPASYNSPNVISVASANCTLNKSFFSNYGNISVDVFAPGENIWGYNQNWDPVIMSGTSQAAAFVTKLATYLATHQSSFDWYLLKCAILNGVATVPQTGYVATDGHIVSAAAFNHLINVGNCTDSPAYKQNNDFNLPTDKQIKYISSTDLPTFEIVAEQNQQAEILISNINGEVLYREMTNLHNGRNQYTFDFTKNKELGIYFFSINDKSGVQTIKFIR